MGKGGIFGRREDDDRLGAAAHEDSELGFRLHLSGLRIIFCREALGYHYHVVSLEDACAKIEVWRIDYNAHRPHSSLGGRSPTSRVHNVRGQDS